MGYLRGFSVILVIFDIIRLVQIFRRALVPQEGALETRLVFLDGKYQKFLHSSPLGPTRRRADSALVQNGGGMN